MEFSNNIAKAFCLLRISQPELFSQEHLAELETLLVSSPDDPVAMDKAISSWCLKHLEIKYAMYAMLAKETEKNSSLDDVRFAKNAKPDPKTRIQDKRLHKTDVLNAIRYGTLPPPTTSSNK